MGERERVEHRKFVHRVTVTLIQPDIAGERCCLATDMNNSWDVRGGQQIDDLAPGTGARRVEHGHIGPFTLRGQCPPNRIADHPYLRKVGQCRARRTGRRSRTVDADHLPGLPHRVSQGRGEKPCAAVEIPCGHTRIGSSPVAHQVAVSPGRVAVGLPEDRDRHLPTVSPGSLHPMVTALDYVGRIAPGNQQLTLRAALNGNGRLDGQIAINGAQQVLTGQLGLHLDNLNIISLFTDALANVKGRLDGDFRFGGTLKEPSVTGRAAVTDFAAEVPDAGLKLSQGHVTLSATDAQQLRIDGSVQSGKGSIALAGVLGLDAQTPSTLTLKGSQFTAIDIPAAKVAISPDVLLRHDAQGLNATGSVLLDSADVNLDKLPGNGVNKGSSDVVIVDQPQQPANNGPMPITASIKVDLGQHAHLVGMGLDGRLSGVLTVNERPGRNTTGQGQISVNGTYKAYGQNLQIQQGLLLFASTPIDNPGLNIRAVRSLTPNATIDEGQQVGLMISGTAQRPVLTVFSNPVMEQSDALSYLVTGKPLSQVKGGEGNMVNAAAQALGSATGNLLAKSIGSKLGIDDIGVSSSDALGGNSAFTVGKYLSPRLYLSYGVGLFEPGQVITLRYRLSKRWSFEAQNATDFNRASLNYRIEK
jgi:translocation and assembly module TamB